VESFFIFPSIFKADRTEKEDVTANKKTTPRHGFKLLFFD
jgi:hypothetical protein